MKFKVHFIGFAYVEADDVEEVIEKFNVDEEYREEEIKYIEAVDEFNISM